MARLTRVKNKGAARIQVMAEQILKDSKGSDEMTRVAQEKLRDSEELAEYRLRKRKLFEDQIRRVGCNVSVYVKYAKWEESQKDFKRARSIWERALEVVDNYKNPTMWLNYAEMEMKNKFINHPRNVWDRAVSLLPRIDQLWYKYIYMEEMLGNVAGAREVYERWMQWQPDQHEWLSFIRFELRYNEIDRASGIYERFVQCHPKVGSWIRYAKFGFKNGDVARARNCYERAVDDKLKLQAEQESEEELELLLVSFAEFEERCNEIERARCIYKYALDRIPKGSGRAAQQVVYDKFVAFEKRYGSKQGIDDAILWKKCLEYEDGLHDIQFAAKLFGRTRLHRSLSPYREERILQ